MNEPTNHISTILETAGLTWSIIIIVCLIIIIMLLSWLLIRREKALQLLSFSLTPTGIKLTYELNKDEKLKTLALENITLQNEVNGLKSSLRKERWHSLILVILMLFIFLLDKFKIRNNKNDKKVLEEKKDNEGETK